MLTISLHTSACPESIAQYTSTVVPRIGEHIRLLETPGAVVLVTGVFYQAHGTDRGAERIELQVAPANDAARAFIGQMLYMSA